MLSAGYLCESSFFWMSGILMDRFGRKVSGFIAMLIMASGFLVLGFGSNLSPAVFVAVCVVGFGNSFSRCVAHVFRCAMQLISPRPIAAA